jgi:hypothetical protein
MITNPDTFFFPMATAVSPYHLGKMLTAAFPELPEAAGEAMEGELIATNRANRNYRGRYGINHGVGPAWSQIWDDEDDEDRDDSY